MEMGVGVEGVKRLKVVRSIRKANGQTEDDENPGLSVLLYLHRQARSRRHYDDRNRPINLESEAERVSKMNGSFASVIDKGKWYGGQSNEVLAIIRLGWARMMRRRG